MRRFNFLMPFILAALLAFQIGHAGPSSQDGTGEYVTDAMITTKVKAAILAEPTLKSTEIHVETNRGVVHLSGLVRSEANVAKAIEVTSNVKGVISVQNDMRMK